MPIVDLHLHAAGVTDVGKRRRENQDSMVVRNDVCLWAVADGMGGHQAGRWASEQIKNALDELPLSRDFDADFRQISNAVHGANTTIAAESERVGATIGSTVAVLYGSESRFAIFWAGDSRVYLLRQGELVRMTTDHTQVQEMVDEGLLTVEEAEMHPDRHVLSRAVGVGHKLTLDAMMGDIEPGDRFLLCSDGLTGVVTDAEIGEQLGATAPDPATRQLLDLVLSRNAPDNVTIIAVVYQQR